MNLDEIEINNMDEDSKNAMTMKKFAEVLSTQLLYKAYNLKRSVKTDDDLTHLPLFDCSISPKNQDKAAVSTKKNGIPLKKGGGKPKKTVIDLTRVCDSGSSDGSRNKSRGSIIGVDLSSEYANSNVAYYVGAARAGSYSPLSNKSDDDNYTMDSDDFDMSVVKKSDSTKLLQVTRDVRSCKHTAVKMKMVYLRGMSTKNRPYVRPKMCQWCGKKTTVKCLECDNAYCYPLDDSKGNVIDSCFYSHVKVTATRKKDEV